MNKKTLTNLAHIAAILFVTVICDVWAYGQTGTPHGVNVTWTAPSPAGGSGTIAGYNVYRCPGTCTAASTAWVKIDTSLDLTNGYLDQSTLVAGSTYSYASTAVDSTGNESAFSNVATITFVAVPNPGAPSGCNAKVQ
jgi:hypothetical protein